MGGSGVARPSWLPGLSEILPGQTSCQLDVSVMWHRKILEYFNRSQEILKLQMNLHQV